MREEPSPELVALLAALDLATPDELSDVRRHARRLAQGLPLFDSVWVDALAQARQITTYQAAEINAGRGPRLAVGQYVISRPQRSTGYADTFLARQKGTRRAVRLLIARVANLDRRDAERGLSRLLQAAPHLADLGLSPVDAAEFELFDGHIRLWAAAPSVEGINAADWMVAHGRVSPAVVLEIARQMVADLAALDRFELVHGDLATAGVVLTPTGRVWVPHAGIRSIVRPEEGYGSADLPPEAYDTLAPEQIVDGTPPDARSELFACGCLWWHLLAGRPPLAGGDALGKLKSARAARIADVRHLAPDTPAALADVVGQCLSPHPARRGQSFAELIERLGPSTREGRQAIAACVRGHSQPTFHWITPPRVRHKSRAPQIAVAAVVVSVLACGAVLYPKFQRTGDESPPRMLAAHTEADVTRPPGKAGGYPALASHAEFNVASGADEAQPVRQVRCDAAESAPRPALPPNELVLDPNAPADVQSWHLREGQRVRGANHARVEVQVPTTGLRLTVTGVSFENIDFHFAEESADEHDAAIIRLTAESAEFRNCTFQIAKSAARPRLGGTGPEGNVDRSTKPVAVACRPAGGRQRMPLTRALKFTDCTFHGVGAAVSLEAGGVLSVDIDSTLLVDSGTLVRLQFAPQLDQPASLTLKNVTLRNSDSLVESSCATPSQTAGRISVSAVNCAFAPEVALFVGCGAESPQSLLAMSQWTGQGSLLIDTAAMAVWKMPDGPVRKLDDSEIAVDGLARSRLEFAGADTSERDASRVVRWTAPLQGNEPPGIGPRR